MTPDPLTPEQRRHQAIAALGQAARIGDAVTYQPAGACPLCRSFTGHTPTCLANPDLGNALESLRRTGGTSPELLGTSKRRPHNRYRFHYRDGRTVTVTAAQLATENATTVRGAADLVDQWLAAGDLTRRPDGGYDVIRYRPPKAPRRRP